MATTKNENILPRYVLEIVENHPDKTEVPSLVLSKHDDHDGDDKDKHKDNNDKKNDSVPTRTETAKDLNLFLVQEMNRMTVEERERVYEELHGCEQIIQETPELIHQELEELDLELSKICHSKKQKAYEMALEQNRDYITSKEFCLAFLRADYFDAKKAAMRLVRFLEKILHYFGKDCLARPLRLTDLDKEAMEGLKGGHLQLLPNRDRAGRAVLCDFQNLFPENYRRGIKEMQVFIYLFMSALEDVETQKRGFVVILYHIGRIRFNIDPELIRQAPMLDQWLPIRLTGAHICHDRNPVSRLLNHVVLMNAGRTFRSRYRFHQGSHAECQFGLMTFGIPTENFPLTPLGELKRTNPTNYITKRQLKESLLASGKEFHRIDLPARADVLSGKGRPAQEHPGNIHLRRLVDQRLVKYMQLGKKQKDEILSQVVNEVQMTLGGRFLKKDHDGYWIQLEEKEIRYKVRRMFTTAVGSLQKKNSKAANEQQHQQQHGHHNLEDDLSFCLEPSSFRLPNPRSPSPDFPIEKRPRLSNLRDAT